MLGSLAAIDSLKRHVRVQFSTISTILRHGPEGKALKNEVSP